MERKPLLSSREVMRFFGYNDRSSFWKFVKAKYVPHVRLNQRRIMFDPRALNEWIARRSTDKRLGPF